MSEHKPNTRYHNGARDNGARADHAAVSRTWRRDIADALFNDNDRTVPLEAVASGVSVREAATSLGLYHQTVYARCRWDLAFAEQLETALAAACPAGDRCGTTVGYRYGGRCRNCRRAHHRPRAETSGPAKSAAQQAG